MSAQYKWQAVDPMSLPPAVAARAWYWDHVAIASVPAPKQEVIGGAHWQFMWMPSATGALYVVVFAWQPVAATMTGARQGFHPGGVNFRQPRLADTPTRFPMPPQGNVPCRGGMGSSCPAPADPPNWVEQ
jgi:hypothetical protein